MLLLNIEHLSFQYIQYKQIKDSDIFRKKNSVK